MKHTLKHILSFLLLGLFLMPAAAVAVDGFEVADGIHYENLSPAQAPVGESGKLEVVEFFAYGCGHCHHFEPTLHPWTKTLPNTVKFERVPVSFGNPSWDELIKLYYALEAIDAVKTHHKKVFDAIHENKINLANPKTRDIWLKKQNVDIEKFNAAFDSFAVDTKVRQAHKLARDYNVQSVPSMYVGGKYQTGSRLSGSNKNTLKVVDYLIKKALN